MQSILVLTISGKDRAGLVEQLADVIAAHGGNWEHCRMAHLAERFVGLLQVSVSGEQQQDLEVALRTINDLDVMIAASDGPEALQETPSVKHFDLELVGGDRPGIVRDVFKALASVGVNVEELESKSYSAPDSGAMLFEAKASLACPLEVDREAVRTQLELIAQDIMVDIDLKN